MKEKEPLGTCVLFFLNPLLRACWEFCFPVCRQAGGEKHPLFDDTCRQAGFVGKMVT